MRGAAVEALGQMGMAAAPMAKEITSALIFDGGRALDAKAFASLLDQWGNPSGDLDLQAALLAVTHEAPAAATSMLRAHLRLWAAGNAAMQRSVTWLGKPDVEPMPKDGLPPDEARETLALFLDLWDHTADKAALRTELAGRITVVSKSIKPDAATAKILEGLARKLKDDPLASAAHASVEEALGR